MLQIAARVGGWAGTPIGKAWEVGRGKLVKLVEAARPGVAAAAAGAVAAAVAVAAAASSATVVHLQLSLLPLGTLLLEQQAKSLL